MTEVVKCPNCNAQLHAVPDRNILKCEYCDTEIIINNMQNFSAQANGFYNQTNNNITENYMAEMNKWKKSFHVFLIIQAVLTALFELFLKSGAYDIVPLAFIASVIYSFAMPFHVIGKKPLSPLPHENNKFLDFMKVYPAFAGAFWGGMIIIIILLSI